MGVPFYVILNANIKSISLKKRHILSHQIIFAWLISIELENSTDLSNKFIRVNKKDIYKFAVPKLLEQFIEELMIG